MKKGSYQMAIQKFIVSRDDSIYEAFPDVVLTEKGKLICVFAECKHHLDRSFTRIVRVESEDRGRNWTRKVPLSDETNGGPYWDCPRISRLKDNRLVVSVDQIAGPDIDNSKIYLWYGDPEGIHWHGPIETPALGIVPDKICELSSGRWLLSAHQKSKTHGYLEQLLWYSDNSGIDWAGPITIASQSGLNLCEVSIISLKDGTLVAFMRENSNEGLDCHKAISKNDGQNWEGPFRVPIPGCHRPTAGILKSGKIMITHRFMQGGRKEWAGTWTQNFFATLTDEPSALASKRVDQWTRIMPIDFDRSPVSDLGYSGWVQFPDGEIYIVNYIVDDAPKAHIRGYSLYESDFML
jgi:hypothetical protein